MQGSDGQHDATGFFGAETAPRIRMKAMEILNRNCSRPTSSGARTKSNNEDENKDNEEEVQSFAQGSNFRSYKEGKTTWKGKDDCTHKNKPTSEWAAHKAMALANRNFAQTSDDASASSVASGMPSQEVSVLTKASKSPSWMMLQAFQFAGLTKQEFRELILLDNQSTEHLCCSPQCVKVTQDTNDLSTVITNSSNLKVAKTATLPGFGSVWFNFGAITSMLSQAKVRDDPIAKLGVMEKETVSKSSISKATPRLSSPGWGTIMFATPTS